MQGPAQAPWGDWQGAVLWPQLPARRPSVDPGTGYCCQRLEENQVRRAGVGRQIRCEALEIHRLFLLHQLFRGPGGGRHKGGDAGGPGAACREAGEGWGGRAGIWGHQVGRVRGVERLWAGGRALPLFSQDAHGQGCQCGHCLHFFCVGPWHPGHPGVWTGSQALHAAPVFTWAKKPRVRKG